MESWRQIPDGFGPDFTNFFLVVVAEDEGGVLIKSLKITGGANHALIPGLNIVPPLMLLHPTLGRILLTTH